MIASHADLLLLVLRSTKDCRWRAEQAKEIIDNMGVQPAGVIVNATSTSGWQGFQGRYDALKEANESIKTPTAELHRHE